MMDSIEASAKAQTVLGQLLEHPRLGRYIDSSLEIPRGFRGSGEIRLIILGQDPTVKNERSRQTIRCVLNLDSRGNLWNYLSQVCRELGIELSRNVYATNLLKNFLVAPPTQIKEIDVFQEALPFWLPLLKEELAEFPSVPVLALGAEKLEHEVQALELAARSVRAGAQGVVFGRNVVQARNPAQFLKALKAVVKDGMAPAEAAAQFGLEG